MNDIIPVVGQVWQSRDRRNRGQKVKIIRMDGSYAVVMRVDTKGPETLIRLDRFRPTSNGYCLVPEIEKVQTT